tara:strand:+ start:1732 stop:2439 length:708 start_codon:yes stop_codon:yes gene_type:complete
MNGNTNMLLFVDSATVAYMNSSSNFRGMSHTADDDIEVYFQSASDASSFDTVLLSCTDEKQVEAMKGLAGAIHGSASKAFTVVADDVAGTYCHPNVTAIESVTLGQKGSLVPIETLTAARVVSNADSGTTFICSGAAGKAITLPAVADVTAGWNCRFIVGQAFATTDWIITATAAIMVGGINELTDSVGPSTVAGTTINIELGAETIGDYVDFVCDGTKFFIRGQSKLDGAFTLA